MLQQKIHLVANQRLTAYAKEVVLNRAVPDYRDGLKPVHRRILWSMYRENFRSTGSFVKCARVVGDVIGKYHPHGDSSIYDALVGIVNSSVPLIKGQGNFGNHRDEAAAYRYTECRLSKIADKLIFGNDFIETVPIVPNYDDKSSEPVFLPAQYPNLLLNGTQGIAYGVSAYIPPLHPEPVMTLIARCLKGERITSAMIFETLRFNWPWESKCVSADDAIKVWLESGRGPLYFQPKFEYDERKRTITFKTIPPNFNYDSIIDNFGKKDWITDFEDLTDKKSPHGMVDLRVKIKGGSEDFEKRLRETVNIFTNTFSCATTTTNRGLSLAHTTVDKQTLSQFIHVWCHYRINIEKDLQAWRIQQIQKGIELQDLLLLVIAHLEAVAKIIKTSDNPKASLISLLKITPEQAEQVLDFTLRRLTRLNKDQVGSKKQSLLKDKKQALDWRSNPRPKVISDMNGYSSIIAAS